MNIMPKALEELIEAFGTMPGIGPRTAERYSYHLLRAESHKSETLSRALSDLHKKVKYCPVTFALIDSDQTRSPLYDDPRRDKKLIAVVADPFDIMALERTGQFKGTYHVLGGLISPIDGVQPETLHIDALIERVAKDSATELILATSVSVEGESTALYIAKKLEGQKIKITRLARGLPIGLDLEYADQITLGRALEGRQSL